VDETVNDEDPNKDNPVLTSLSQESQEKRRERKAEQWFKKIGDLDDDSDLEDAEMEKAVEKVHKSGGTLNKKQKDKPQESDYASDGSDTDEDTTTATTTTTNSKDEEQPEDLQKQKDESSSDESSSDEDDSEVDTDEEQSKPKVDAGGFEIVPQKPIPQPKIKKRKQMSAEQLAIGEQLIKSKKSKRDLMDAGWNRYMFDDVALPDWFALDQENHYTRKVEVDPETVKKYQDREKELNVKTIKKVVEAKARRKKRVQLKLAKAKKKASALLDNADIGSHEKAREIKQMYKSAQVEARRKKDVKYIVSKKYNAGKKPSGTKGPYKQVDPRMKKDNSKKRGNATSKKNQKRRLKGPLVPDGFLPALYFLDTMYLTSFFLLAST
jgi:AdoMet-dependent rRNA methyltransferase SPB1